MAKGIKTGGREIGTPNRITSEMRAVLKNIIAEELEKLPETFKAMEPKDRAEAIIKLMPYVFPKVEPVHSTYDEPW